MGYKLWTVLVGVRILLCLWPMNAYIHPDEFFQNTEPLAGDIFGMETMRPWEFNSTKPLRCIFFPHITTGLGMKLLQYSDAAGVLSLSPYSLLVVPRLMMVVVSLLCIDYPVYMIAKLLEMQAATCLTILASSFVTLAYHTRTFSNSYESMTFALLLLLVVDSRLDQLKPPRPASGKAAEREPDRPNHAFWIGVFIVEGTFNRISFPCFALIPLVFWLTGSASEFGVYAVREVVRNTLALLPGALTMLVSNVVMDSVYYGSLDPAVLADPQLLYANLNYDFLTRNLTVTPLNSVMYHLDVDNIARHGLHPRLTHFLVNLPMLFLPLVVCFAAEVVAVVRGARRAAPAGFAGSSGRAFLVLCFVTPTLLLSLVPHQEARFLVPALVPLVLLYAEFVVSGVSVPNVPWVAWNALGCLMFGLVHQGGVVPSVMHAHGLVSQPAATPTQYHLVYFHTYMPPRHLALYTQSQPALSSPPDPPTAEPAQLPNTVTFHDLMGADRLALSTTVNDLLSPRLTPVPNFYKKEVYVFAPASLDPMFCRLAVKHNYKLAGTFFPHVSTEDVPEFTPPHVCVAEPDRNAGLRSRLQKWRAMFSLNMYKADVVRVVPHVGEP